jgi:hypothetical protein
MAASRQSRQNKPQDPFFWSTKRTADYFLLSLISGLRRHDLVHRRKFCRKSGGRGNAAVRKQSAFKGVAFGRVGGIGLGALSAVLSYGVCPVMGSQILFLEATQSEIIQAAVFEFAV